MLKPVLTLCVMSGMLVLSGCKETKSEAWYKEHPGETYKVYMQCLRDGISDNGEFAHRAALMFAQTGKTRHQGKIRDAVSAGSPKKKTVTQ